MRCGWGGGREVMVKEGGGGGEVIGKGGMFFTHPLASG